MTKFPHGEQRGYSRGCHCDQCRTAHAAYRKRRRQAASALPAKQIPHGTCNGYINYRCHCDLCRAANAAYQREYNARRRAS